MNKLRDDLKVYISKELVLQLLSRAAGIGFNPAVERLVPHLTDPDDQQTRNTLQVHANIAAQQGSFDVALTLCKYHPVCLQQMTTGDSPIIYAAGSEDGAAKELVTFMLENGVSANVQNLRGSTALHSAVQGFNKVATELLLENRACVLLPDEDGMTPLQLSRGKPLEVQLVEAMQYEDHPSPEMASLYLAALKGDRDCIQAQIDAGISINSVWIGGKTCLHGAVESASPDSLYLVEYLLENGASLTLRSNASLFIVNFALTRNKMDLTAFLLEKLWIELQNWSKESISLHQDVLGKALRHTLYILIKGSHLELIEKVLIFSNVGIDISLDTYLYQDKLKAIHIAAKFGHKECMEYLINSKGLNPLSTDCHGNTCLHYACFYGHIEVAELLVKRFKVNVNQKNTFDATPLYCCLEGKISTDSLNKYCLECSVIFLIINGAKLMAPNSSICELRDQAIDSDFNSRWSFVPPHTRRLLLTFKDQSMPLKLSEICRLKILSEISDPSDKTFLSLHISQLDLSFLRCD